MKKMLIKALAITAITVAILWFWAQQAVAVTGTLSMPLSKLTPSPTLDPVKYQGDTTPVALGAVLLVMIIIAGILITVKQRN